MEPPPVCETRSRRLLRRVGEARTRGGRLGLTPDRSSASATHNVGQPAGVQAVRPYESLDVVGVARSESDRNGWNLGVSGAEDSES